MRFRVAIITLREVSIERGQNAISLSLAILSIQIISEKMTKKTENEKKE